MRRIPRLQQRSAVLTQCLQTATATAPSSHSTLARAAATTTTTTTTVCLPRSRDFTTTSSRPFEVPKLSSLWGNKEKGPEPVAPVQAEPEPRQQGDATELALDEKEEFHTDLVIPSLDRENASTAPRSEELLAAEIDEYIPAQSANGLKMVGGTKDWFNDERHLPKSKLDELERFAPQKKITDRSVLELCVRRAVLEALIMQPPGSHGPKVYKSWRGRSSEEAAERVHGLDIAFDSASKVPFVIGSRHTIKQVRKDLDPPPPPPPVLESQEEGGLVTPGTVAGASPTSSSLEETSMEPGIQGVQEIEVVESDMPTIHPEEAQKMCEGLSSHWKRISLEDVPFRFAVTKRVYQLTGHRIPDSKQHTIKKAIDVLTTIARPPAPKTVYEAITQQDQLSKMPNVTIHSQRRTPITKATEVGRWKVIKKILEERNLPVTGTGGVGKYVETNWFRGPRVVKNRRKGLQKTVY